MWCVVVGVYLCGGDGGEGVYCFVCIGLLEGGMGDVVVLV